MYIPDPIELMQVRVESLCERWERAQQDVPEGSYRCPYCCEIFDYEPISVSAAPDAAVCCYDCLPADARAAYDAFETRLEET